MKKGLLLINLGTPAAPTKEAVKRYLKQFLSDQHVVNLPKFVWQPILNGIILKTRPAKSAHAYAQIWTERGSPLLVYAYDLAEKLEKTLNINEDDQWYVSVGMSYGCPCIRNGLQKLISLGVDEITILPLYPQYSTATTKSVYADIDNLIQQGLNVKSFNQIPPYYSDNHYINALAKSIESHWEEHGKNFLMLSYHGLPQANIKRGDPYAEQCEKTTDLLVKKLNLNPDEFIMTYQSRFGAQKWLEPYTDKTLEKLAKDGLKNIDVVCPGFAADCLETLEEIAIQNAEIFTEMGGETLNYIPALNASDIHVSMFDSIIKNNAIHLPLDKINHHLIRAKE